MLTWLDVLGIKYQNDSNCVVFRLLPLAPGAVSKICDMSRALSGQETYSLSTNTLHASSTSSWISTRRSLLRMLIRSYCGGPS